LESINIKIDKILSILQDLPVSSQNQEKIDNIYSKKLVPIIEDLSIKTLRPDKKSKEDAINSLGLPLTEQEFIYLKKKTSEYFSHRRGNLIASMKKYAKMFIEGKYDPASNRKINNNEKKNTTKELEDYLRYEKYKIFAKDIFSALNNRPPNIDETEICNQAFRNFLLDTLDSLPDEP